MGTDKDTQPNIINNPSQPYILRRCALADLENVIKVNEEELPEDYPYFFYKSILDNYPEAFLIAVDKISQKVIGYIMWRIERTPSPDSLRLINKAHLVSIATSEGYRRIGVATGLLANSMAAIKKRNISEYVLEVRISNNGAIKLYEKFNYETTGIKKKYYRDGENAYYMVCLVD